VYRPVTILALALLCACSTSVTPDYEAARDNALAKPTVLAADWRPDAVVHLSPALVDELVTVVVQQEGSFKKPFEVPLPVGKARVQPNLHLDSLDLQSTRRCESCLAVYVSMSGVIKWTTPIGGGKSDVEVHADVDVLLQALDQGDKWIVTALPKQVRSLDLKLGRGKQSLPKVLEGKLAKQIEDRILADAAPRKIAEFGANSPLLGVRLVPAGGGIGIAMHTDSPTPTPLPSATARISEGWRLDLSEGSLTGIAARKGFETGAASHEVVIEPTSIDFEDGRFDMGLRLWRTAGRGWWRDYMVHGTVELKKKRIALKEESVDEMGKSPGADLADPLAALGQGLILRAIEDSVAASIPRSDSATHRGLVTTVELNGLSGATAGVLTVIGALKVEQESKGTSIKRTPRK